MEKEPDINISDLTAERIKIMLRRAIESIDKRLNEQINEILHYEDFKRLESSWRGIRYLTEQNSGCETEMTCKVKIINLNWHELSRDIGRAIDFDQSDFFRLIYSNEFTMPGGEPFGLLLGDYRISHKSHSGLSSNDIDTLQGISSASAAAFAPFITAADPSLFGVDRFSDLAHVKDIAAQFSQAEYFKWRSLRESEDSRFLGIVVPSMLMREPYKRDGSRRECFYFNEKIQNSETDYLWGNGAYAFAAVTLKAFSESGWFSQIRGIVPGQFKRGLVFNLPKSRIQLSRNVEMLKPAVDLQVGDHLEKQLSDGGFIPLSALYQTEYLAFYSNASVNKPRRYESESANVNSRLSSMLQYTLCASRFAHYIKVMGRDKIGSYNTAEELENEFQRWLFQYTTASDEASDEVRAKYPLNEAKIKVREYAGRTGYFYSIIHLRPHFQLDEMVSSMRLITELSPNNYTTG
ncbi:type VI secretion system contractile sheath large subunit [Photobacterium atrarenae]|uniref:Type VI secretion system contractile sheath large subunit n=1 Tax=Photobacterium atrarenae TaxID=865757 RepID=A0ABY5GC44_9GAMM|nr:type VI secretion system contractile sheath large subunit [Photobacterium atrarenae]UTV26493.1 type VI secretion system contractile sheath large subunit [Photobacterium atrarenae]